MMGEFRFLEVYSKEDKRLASGYSCYLSKPRDYISEQYLCIQTVW